MRYLLALLLMLGSACDQTSQKDASLLSVSDSLALGTPYDTAARRLLSSSLCIEGETNKISGEITWTEPLKALTLNDLETLYKPISVTENYQPQPKVLLESIAETDSRSSISFYHARKLRQLNFKPGTIKAKNEVLSGGAPQIRSRCGDQFISEIEMRYSLLANLVIDFKDKDQKDALGKDLVFTQGSDGKIAPLRLPPKNFDKTSVKVSVIAILEGGKMPAFYQVLPGGKMSCSVEETERCVNAYNELLAKYPDIVPSEERNGHYRTVGYSLTDYGRVVPQLVHEDYVSPAPETIMARVQVEDFLQRANMVLDLINEKINLNEIRRSSGNQDLLLTYRRDVEPKIKLYSRVLDTCLDSPFATTPQNGQNKNRCVAESLQLLNNSQTNSLPDYDKVRSLN